MSGADFLFSHRVVFCVGPGGVGKTTISAALAMAAARTGRRTLVVTIDPARRLADALGVEPDDDTPTPITGHGLPPGGLPALMLEPKRAFDALVARLSPDAATRDALYANRLYQHISARLAGSAEYAAMARVQQLAAEEDIDLLVVDTPPSAHALDFIDAPSRLNGLLDPRALQWWIRPAANAGRLGFRWFQRGARGLLHTLERITGLGFLEDVSEFLIAFERLTTGFRGRAREMEALLFGPDAAYVLATGPSASGVAETEAFRSHLEERGVVPVAIVANRVRSWSDPEVPLPPTDDTRRALDDAVRAAGFDGRDVGAAAWAVLDGYARGVLCDREALDPMLADAEAAGTWVRRIPELAEDVHDLSGLVRIERFLSAADPEGKPV